MSRKPNSENNKNNLLAKGFITPWSKKKQEAAPKEVSALLFLQPKHEG